jgi:glycosyltransferase involved in cell wall biosynthesis
MEPGARPVVRQDTQDDAAGRARQHRRHRAGRVPMLAEQVADAGAVACADDASGTHLGPVRDDELRVVPDPRARIDGADEVVDLLAGRPRRAGAQAELLVEWTEALDQRPAQEERVGDRAVPEVVPRELRRVLLPRRGRPAVGGRRPSCEPVERRLCGEPPRDAFEQVAGVDAVVIGKGDDVCRELRERRVPGTREAAFGLHVDDVKHPIRQYPAQPIVLVLVDDDHAKRAMGLALQRVQKGPDLVHSVDGRHDEVERGELARGHSRTLAPVPLVSVLLAAHDEARYVGAAIDSVLGQTLRDLELVVVDDASTDGTSDVLADVRDDRLVVLRNEEQLGLAASLNRGLERASGRYMARLDADDVALPRRLELQVARMRSEPPVAVLGTDIADLDEAGRSGQAHEMPRGPVTVRWHALFGAPFFHPTVLVDRELLDEHGLRYDPAYLESEDYDLWARLLALADGDNLAEPLVLKRTHPGQASERRADLQISFQQQVALREIARVAPELTPEEAELAWGLGSGRRPSREGAAAYLRLLERFEARHGVDRRVRKEAAQALARAGAVAQALRLSPALPLRVPAARLRRRRLARTLPRHEREGATRVAVVSPEPTPYRAPLFDLVSARPEVELTVIYAAQTVARRTWKVEPAHRAVFLAGVRVPGFHRVVRHDYPFTPGIHAALRDADPEVVVVSGWSTYAAQAAIGWCRTKRVPYVVLVESHDVGPRAGWRRAVKGAVVPRLLRGAAGVLVVGGLARRSVVERGADPGRVRVFANTVDVRVWEERARRLAERRDELRGRLGAGEDDVLMLSVGRLAPEKGMDTLIRAAGGDERLVVGIAGAGPERANLERLAQEHGVRLELLGDLDEEALAEAYAAADGFALLSLHEPWGVVVNEAAASGLPLLLSDRVGAAHDLLRNGENGILVPAGDVGAAAAALERLRSDRAFRERAGERSRELVREWGYEPSVESFVVAVSVAVSGIR